MHLGSMWVASLYERELCVCLCIEMLRPGSLIAVLDIIVGNIFVF